MALAAMKISLGIEEELILVDGESFEALVDPDPAILAEASARAEPHRVVNEFLRCQLETNSKVCGSVGEAHQSVLETRRAVSDAANAHGAKILACSTHPWARWEDQLVTEKPRYLEIDLAFQDTVRQYFVGGMHIHAGFGNHRLRIEVMDAIVAYLPLFLSLSASSPFHAGRLTGLKSYRLTSIGGIPRTGLPPVFEQPQHYRELVRRYIGMGAIGDASELRWDIRPSANYPTVELRICDVCTKADDAASIAALYACLIARLSRQPRKRTPREVTEESRWLAQRYGTFSFMPDPDTGEMAHVGDIAERLAEDLDDEAKALGCGPELEGIVRIARDGTSADRQEDCYREALLSGENATQALRKVAMAIADETTGGFG